MGTTEMTGLSLLPRHASAPPRVLPFLNALPDRLRPTLESRHVQAALIWGYDYVLDIQELEPGKRLTIGSDEKCTMQVCHEFTRQRHVPIVQTRDDGSATVYLPAGATVRFSRDGQDFSIVQLVEQGLAEPIHAPVEGARIDLELHDQATLWFGQLRLIVRFVKPTWRRPEKYDAGFWSRVAIYVLTAVTVYRMAIITEPDDFEAPDPPVIYWALAGED